MGKIEIRKTLGNLSSRLSDGFTFWQALAPATAAGIMTGWLSTTVSWAAQFGAFGWWGAGLLGFLVFAGAQALIGVSKDRRARARALNEWPKTVDSVNPMRTVFDNERLRMRDLAHPLTQKITAKTFNQCELFGPENIAMMGNTITGTGFYDCEFIVVKDNTLIRNVVLLDQCHIVGGSLWNLTIFMNQAQFNDLKANLPQIASLTYEQP